MDQVPPFAVPKTGQECYSNNIRKRDGDNECFISVKKNIINDAERNLDDKHAQVFFKRLDLGKQTSLSIQLKHL